MSDDLTSMTMDDLLSRYAQFSELCGVGFNRRSASEYASATRAEIDRRLAEVAPVVVASMTVGDILDGRE